MVLKYMDNIKDDTYYLNKVIENIAFAVKTLENVGLEQFKENEVLSNAIMFSFIQISENVSKLTVDFKNSKKDVPWNKIKAIRNIIVHDYDIVEYDTIYETVKEDFPTFRKQISN